MVRALACIGCAAAFSGAVFAQSNEAKPKFGIADIHASAPNTIPQMRSGFSHGRYELRNATLVDLIRTAWSVDAENVVGGPDWLDSDRFDVIATAPAGSTQETLKTMLRGLLADRFHLVVHKDTRDRRAYVMTAGKKPQLKESDGSEQNGCKFQRGGNGEPVVFACRNMTMAAFANEVPNMWGASGATGYLFNYRVVDRTGLKGAWDFDVKWSLRATGPQPPAVGDTITIFDAFEKQLGLKLSLLKVSMPVVVVDSVNEKPTDNLPGVTEKPPAPPEFEVAVIKPEAPDGQGTRVGIQPGGRVRITATLKGLIAEAWGDMNHDRIVGGPKYLDTNLWVLVAKAPVPADSQAGWNGPVWNGVDIDSMRKMLRALLIDRFKLAAHTEDRLVSGYALVAAKPKLRKADPSNRPGCKEGPGADGKDPRIQNPVASRLITCRNMTLAQFAAGLNNFLYQFPPVVDSTGIAGRYDMTINFSPPSAIQSTEGPVTGGDAVASEPDGTISIFEALDQQLGLKLKSRKVMAPVLVIDHVNEMPTDN